MEKGYKTLVHLIFISLLFGNGQGWEDDQSKGGGQCVSHAQYVCGTELTHLIDEEQASRQYVCKYFGLFHTCMMKSMASCRTTEKETRLYKTDITNVYTSPPHSCVLVKGGSNLQFKGMYNKASNLQNNFPGYITNPLFITIILPYLISLTFSA